MTIFTSLSEQAQKLDTLRSKIVQAIDSEDDAQTDILSNHYETAIQVFCTTSGVTPQDWHFKYNYLEKILNESSHDIYAFELAFETFHSDIDKLLELK